MPKRWASRRGGRPGGEGRRRGGQLRGVPVDGAALRAYLQSDLVAVATQELTALMARVAERGQADDDTAMALAVNEVRATRRRARR